jgi:CRP/FNR family transcriptional regulator, cyclic AMP receptor protein
MLEDETVQVLAKATIFHGLTPEEIKIFYQSAERITCEKTATVIEKGVVGAALYIILNGQFEVDLPLGVYIPQLVGGAVERRMSKVQLNALRAGDCFGEYSLLDHQPHSASVVATEAGELLKIPHPAFEAILQAHDRIAKTVYANMLRTLIGRLRKLNVEWSLYLQNNAV